MTEQEKNNYNKYRWFLEQVKPYDGFEVEDYYGVQFMKVKRNNTYDIRLQYDYESHPKNSSSFKVEEFDEVIEWIKLMESYSVNKSTIRKAVKYNPSMATDYTIEKSKSTEELQEEAKEEDWD
ncbi:hypothetical protein OAE88_00525 [bacterium]|nr:hypothetical protein [bacterium]